MAEVTILVVEDESLVAMDIQRTLSRLGYHVPKTARTGSAALELAATLKPHLALMDIKLAGPMDGIETAQLLRQRWNIPVVYLSSYSDDSSLARAKATEPFGYLLKPFNERDLRTAIEVALHKHQLESQLAARERWFSTTLRSIGDAVIATGPYATITFMNPVAERLTGWLLADARGKKLAEVLRLVDAKGTPLRDPIERAVAQGFAVELPPNSALLARTGARLAVDDSAAPILDEDGSLLGGVVVFRDVTDRKKLEHRLANAERLAAIGTMAAAMSHEINNPMAYVVANLAFCRDGLQQILDRLASLESGVDVVETAKGLRALTAELSEALSEADEGADRVRRIVKNLSKFSYVDELEESLLDLPAVLDSAMKLTANEVRHHARLRCEYGTTPFVRANEGQLVQVFTNLLVNAAQAIDQGRADAHEIVVSTTVDDAGRAVVRVRDTGRGMSEEQRLRAFEPFFTTKESGAGLGLGLSITQSILAALGGEISLESKVGVGTTFSVALPAASAEETKRRGSRQSPTPTRRGRVLIIDDEPAIGRSLARMLRSHHDVVCEDDARKAEARIATGETFDVVFCDLMMPVMTGIELFESVRASRPELSQRFVFLTGGAFSESAQAFLQATSQLVVSKPFQAAALRKIVNDFVALRA